MPSEEGSREKSCLIIRVYSVIEPCSPSNLLLLYVWLTFNHIISQKQASHDGIYYERVMHVFANNYLTNPYNLSSYIRNDPFNIWSPCLYLIIINDFKAYIYGKNSISIKHFGKSINMNNRLIKAYDVTKRSWNIYCVPRKYYNQTKYPCLAKSFTAILVYKWESALWPLFR